MIRIVVDDREKDSEVPYELERLGVNINYARLEVGDYIPLPEVVVERKSMKDLIRSIYDGRLFMQCSEMIKHYERALIIVEYTNIQDLIENPAIVYGALASIALDLNISILNAYSARDTAYILLALAKRDKDSKKPMLKKIKKSSSLKEQQLTIIASFPGIGEKLAIRLLERFNTPLAIVNANTNELARVIGYARAERLKKILESKYRVKMEEFDTHWFEG